MSTTPSGFEPAEAGSTAAGSGRGASPPPQPASRTVAARAARAAARSSAARAEADLTGEVTSPVREDLAVGGLGRVLLGFARRAGLLLGGERSRPRRGIEPGAAARIELLGLPLRVAGEQERGLARV